MAIVRSSVEELQQLMPFSVSYSTTDKEWSSKVMHIFATSGQSCELWKLKGKSYVLILTPVIMDKWRFVRSKVAGIL